MIYTWYLVQGASLRGRPPSPATLAHNEELNETRLNEADREVLDFRCKLATCKCQELRGPRKQPGRRTRGRNRNAGYIVSVRRMSYGQHRPRKIVLFTPGTSSTQGSHRPAWYIFHEENIPGIEHARTVYHETCGTEYQKPYRRCNSQAPYVLQMEHSTSAPNERVLRTTQLAKLSFNHPSVVLTADVFQYFYKKGRERAVYRQHQHHISYRKVICEWLDIVFAGRAYFYFFVWRTQRAAYKCPATCWLEPTMSAFACVVAL